VDAAAQSAFDPFGILSPHTAAVAVNFDATGFAVGNVIPGYVLRIPAGDRASVQSAGRYDTGVWTVEFKKPYAGGDFDFAVVPGSSVEFTHEIFDNEGGGHPNDGFDATVYALDFANIPATGIDELIAGNSPVLFSVQQNYPNPFNPTTTIEYSIPKQSYVRLEIYNLMGQTVSTLISEEKQPGTYHVVFGASDQPSGIYFYRLTAGSFSQIKKMVLMK
jgi:hypothetical protein